MHKNELPDRQGLALGLSCYVIWGFVPLYFKLLGGVTPWEVVAHRILWSALLLVVLLMIRGRLAGLREIMVQPHLLRRLMVSSILIAINWLVYIWAVTNNHLLAASLGYFLNPLVNVTLGVLVLKEHLRKAQIVAVAIAGVGVIIAVAGALSEIWISVTLALSFGSYGLVRKSTAVGALEGLAIETAILAPPSLVALFWLAHNGVLGFGRDHYIDMLLILSSVVTSLPLIMFAAAARRLPYATLGILQYIAPSTVFLLAAFLYHEPLRIGMLGAFALIWIALGIFTVDLFRSFTAAKATIEQTPSLLPE